MNMNLFAMISGYALLIAILFIASNDNNHIKPV